MNVNTTVRDAQSPEQVVLIVEDDTDLRQTIQWTLEDEGLIVETAADGQEALNRAARRKPTLVVLDMGLPIIDGNGVAAGLQASYGNSVSILTMTADGRAAEKAKRIGAIGYISKPFDLDALITAVKQALGIQ
ncbi:MAG TPA: response regulator [Ktedonobacter sp.]|nr:response regulator [Ktedonobacter sp.]